MGAPALSESPPHPLPHRAGVHLVVVPPRDLDVRVTHEVGHVAFTEAYLLEVDRSGAAEGRAPATPGAAPRSRRRSLPYRRGEEER